jgi:hypothetical protein
MRRRVSIWFAEKALVDVTMSDDKAKTAIARKRRGIIMVVVAKEAKMSDAQKRSVTSLTIRRNGIVACKVQLGSLASSGLLNF